MHHTTWNLTLPCTLALGLALSAGCGESQIDKTAKATVEEVPAAAPAEPAAEPAKDAAPEAAAAEVAVELAAAPAGALALDKENSKVGFHAAKVTKEHTGGFERVDGWAMIADGQITGFEVAVQTSTVFVDDAPKLAKQLLRRHVRLAIAHRR